jgi:hypothetical protein
VLYSKRRRWMIASHAEAKRDLGPRSRHRHLAEKTNYRPSPKKKKMSISRLNLSARYSWIDSHPPLAEFLRRSVG